MPYAEFQSWRLFYDLEPWGWHGLDILKAEILSMLYNINRGKGRPKDVKDFLTDRLKGILAALKEPEQPAELTRAELLKQIKRDFGVR